MSLRDYIIFPELLERLEHPQPWYATEASATRQETREAAQELPAAPLGVDVMPLVLH